jgi:pilus assembly protein CpaC
VSRRAEKTCFMACCLTIAALAGGAILPVSAIAAQPVGSAAPTIRDQGKDDSLHIKVGHSVVVTTANRLKRVYVSNPAAVSTLTSSPHELLVTAKSPGISSLVVWDETGRSNLYTVRTDIDADTLRSTIMAAFPDEQIAVSATEDRIELSGSVVTQADSDAAVKIAQGYAKDVVNSLRVTPLHPQQVQLKVRFVEVDRAKLAQFGFNFFSTGTTMATATTQQFNAFGLPSSKNGQNVVEIANPLNFFLYNSQYDIGMALQDLENMQVAQILAEPTITSISGEEASFLSGGEFPFPMVQTSGGLASVTIQFRPYGVKLQFTPTVNPDSTIRLKVTPEVSALDYTNQIQISGYTVPAISTRRAQTDIELKSGQSFAISGLLDRRITNALSKTPGIADVPILGQLFRSKNKNASMVELVVIVTPTIVNPLTEPQPTIQEPHLPVPNLDKQKFDKQVNTKKRQGK